MRYIGWLAMYVCYGLGCTFSWIVYRLPDVNEKSFSYKLGGWLYGPYSRLMGWSCDINDRYGFDLWHDYKPEEDGVV